jgi:NhaP-type Na+/H+ or K+/H+ antiporter
MTEDLLPELAAIIVLGVGAQWLAWRLRFPSILLLLIAGFVAGPVAGLLDPDEMFGSLLAPTISLSVGVILFEGGLSLRLSELRGVGHVVRNLVTVGALITWVIGAGAAYLIVGLDLRIAILLGAILVVTGPTVVGPLLEQVRPTGRAGSILRWEGIVIDPLGAILAVLVFETIAGSGVQEAASDAVVGLTRALAVGFALGAAAGALLALALRRYLIPDHLQNTVALAAVIGTVAGCNELQEESGLLAAVVMGFVLSNQSAVPVRHIIEFKENLRVLLIGGLFIVLAARLDTGGLEEIWLETVAFVVVLIVVARPLATLASTWRSGLSAAEQAFLSAMAPRGIVAAAVASIFSLRLAEEGLPDATLLADVSFAAIAGTIAVYGLGATPIARQLGLAQANPQGVLLVGAHGWARQIAKALSAEGFAVKLVDSNWRNVSDGRVEGLSVLYGSALSDFEPGEIDLGGIGQMLALTPNDGVNALAVQRFAEVFGRAKVYQLAPKGTKEGRREPIRRDIRGRILWGPDVTFARVQEQSEAGASVKVTNISDEFTYEDFRARYGPRALALFLITPGGDLVALSADSAAAPTPGDKLVSLLIPGEGTEEGDAAANRETSRP